ncbi:MAG: pentapeptide repeat-containing protein [Symploca sp. SIO2G7]|nr:pentapeptide repeat-containing protein [Symploca sp. SIO2G7]
MKLFSQAIAMDVNELSRRYATGERTFCASDLSGADLSGANLSGANLSGADLSGTNLSGADLSGAKLIRTKFSGAELIGANLIGATLYEADFSGANLSGADLNHADFWQANLRNAQLRAAQLLGTNLERATLTGSYLQDWNINSATNLNDVICEYVYLEEDKQERRPHTGNFAPSQFTKLFQESLETVYLILRNGVDWKALLISFQKLRMEFGSDELSIRSFENKGDGAFVIHINVSKGANKVEIEKYLKRQYKLEAKNELDTNLLEITKLLANQPIDIEAKTLVSVVENNAQSQILKAQPVKGLLGEFLPETQELIPIDQTSAK